MNRQRWQEFPHLLNDCYRYPRTLDQAFPRSTGTGLHVEPVLTLGDKAVIAVCLVALVFLAVARFL